MSWSGRWWTFYKWLGRGIEDETIAGPWYPTRMMDHYQEISAAYCSCRLYYLTNSCHTHLRGFYFRKYSALEHVCSKTSGEAPRLASTIPPSLSPIRMPYIQTRTLIPTTQNLKARVERRGEKEAWTIQDPFRPVFPPKGNTKPAIQLEIHMYHKREHSIDHASLVFIIKYSYGTTISDGCSLVPETVRKWQIVRGDYSTVCSQLYFCGAVRGGILNLDSYSSHYRLIPKLVPLGSTQIQFTYLPTAILFQVDAQTEIISRYGSPTCWRVTLGTLPNNQNTTGPEARKKKSGGLAWAWCVLRKVLGWTKSSDVTRCCGSSPGKFTEYYNSYYDIAKYILTPIHTNARNYLGS